jgi:trimethylamine:corrinoid methyltransferase-like protein
MDTRERAREIARKILAADETPHIPAAIDQVMRETFNILLNG